MTENVVKSEDVAPVAKKQTAKKAAAKKTAPKNTTVTPDVKDETSSGVVIIFESGASYSAGDIRFTRDNRIQEVPADVAEILLALDNFRRPTPYELEDFRALKRD